MAKTQPRMSIAGISHRVLRQWAPVIMLVAWIVGAVLAGYWLAE